jgi:hypothetical protein
MPSLPARRRPILAVVLAAFLLVGLTGPLVTDASAAAAPRLLIDSVVGLTPPPGLPAGAAPTVLVESQGQLTVTIHLESGPASNPKPASFADDTDVTVVTVGGSSFAANEPVRMLAGDTSPVTFTGTIGDVAAGVALRVSAPGATSGTSSPTFDVQVDIVPFTAAKGTSTAQGIGGDGGTCIAPTAEKPICSVVVLPNGAAGGIDNVALSLGACDTYDASSASCGKNFVVQLLADLDETLGGALYTVTAPATLVVKCDKTLCGTKAIQRQSLLYSLSGDGALTQTAAPCPAKNTVGADERPCIDYVQSKRDGSGDTILYLLFVKDLRATWP